MPISKRNRRGVLILGAVLLVIIYSPRILAGYFQDNSLEYTIEELDHVEKQILDSKASRKKKYAKKKQRYSVPQAAFDPNDYALSDWMKLGLSNKQANVILRFTQHGIYSNEELKKIFVITDELFGLIQDSTYYPERPQKTSIFSSSVSGTSRKMIQLNVATHDELIELNGIGDYYAKKIIEYREKLGGFHSQEQLLELWKFTPEKLAKISDQLDVSGDLQKMNINQATYEELVIHPYVSGKVANSIVKMRAQRDGYKNLKDLLDSKLIDRELFNKLEPYIKL
ncbi:MAG: ComEA family DNA-binding protein [Cyclobacteriaceae bacterium]